MLCQWCIQGTETAHDVIREQQVELGVPGLAARALMVHQGQSELLRTAMFSLKALLSTATAKNRRTYKLVSKATVKAGLLPIVNLTLHNSQVRCKQHVIFVAVNLWWVWTHRVGP